MSHRSRTHEPSGHDTLTGLYGADRARSRLLEWQQLSDQQGSHVHAALIELVRFDTVNLAYGEETGDSVLIEIGSRILRFASDEFEDGDWLVARMDGGSFLLATRERCSRERWQWLGEALAEAVAHPIVGPPGAGTLRIFPRVALLRALPGEGPDMVLDRLAQEASDARGKPGQRVRWADRNSQVIGLGSAQLESDLVGAMERGEISILFQPQFACANDIIIGAEALARWDHPTLGRIGAGALFAIAERADQTAQLSRHIAANALARGLEWPDHLKLSINVTPADVATPGFAREFIALVERSGFPADRLTVEITEEVLLGDLAVARDVLLDLKQAGISVALDDFGAGFCNFRYLKQLPLDVLKLDRAMVEDIVDRAEDRSILRAIIAMARALELSITVEGIESEGQAIIVQEEGADSYQGFLRSKPVTSAQIAKLAGSV